MGLGTCTGGPGDMYRGAWGHVQWAWGHVQGGLGTCTGGPGDMYSGPGDMYRGACYEREEILGGASSNVIHEMASQTVTKDIYENISKGLSLRMNYKLSNGL